VKRTSSSGVHGARGHPSAKRAKDGKENVESAVEMELSLPEGAVVMGAAVDPELKKTYAERFVEKKELERKLAEWRRQGAARNPSGATTREPAKLTLVEPHLGCRLMRRGEADVAVSLSQAAAAAAETANRTRRRSRPEARRGRGTRPRASARAREAEAGRRAGHGACLRRGERSRRAACLAAAWACWRRSRQVRTHSCMHRCVHARRASYAMRYHAHASLRHSSCVVQ
jgi:hypothetical protein